MANASPRTVSACDSETATAFLSLIAVEPEIAVAFPIKVLA